jgi:hypothetical protein
MGSRFIHKREFKATTKSAHSPSVAESLLNQQLAFGEPVTVYETDITYITTGGGWLNLAGV